MKRVVVTGANGFIGRFTISLLLDAGYEVHALSRHAEPAKMEGVCWHRVDLMDYPAVNNLLRELKATHLLHLAWYTKHGEFWTSPENLTWVACSLNLLKSFAEHGGKRVLMAGSCAEYDWTAGHCSERQTDCNPATLYGTCKLALQKIAGSYCEQNQVALCWGRIFFVYGPAETEDRFVPQIVNGLLKQETVPCSDGGQLRDFMHVKDVASAFVSLLGSELTGIVNIASGIPVSLREIGEEVMRQIAGQGRLEFGAMPNRLDDPAVLTADVTRLRDELGWKPVYGLQRGLADTIDSWKQGAK